MQYVIIQKIAQKW